MEELPVPGPAFSGSQQAGTGARNPYGLSLVRGPRSGPVCMDIVFVHGLGGKSWDSWTQRNFLKPPFFWPSSLNNTRNLQRVRVWMFGYRAASFKKLVGNSTSAITDFALDLLFRLRNNAEDVSASIWPHRPSWGRSAMTMFDDRFLIVRSGTCHVRCTLHGWVGGQRRMP